MSGSSKKKLRNEQNAAKMTERQLAEQKEAKKLKLYTVAFTVVLVAIIIAAAIGIPHDSPFRLESGRKQIIPQLAHPAHSAIRKAP